jgi:S1-C subfamily serine protease
VTLPEKVLFPYPHPKAIGLVLDPRERATVMHVQPDSPAAAAGFRPGHKIATLSGQPLLSLADVQWVLHQVPAEGGSLEAVVRYEGKTAKLKLDLAKGWRQRDDIAWRASSWELRRIAFGGLFAKNVSAELREAENLPKEGMALKVQHVGQYAPHDRAKRAGFQKDDVLVSFNGRTDLARETDLLEYALNDVEPGTVVDVEVLRGGKRTTLKLSVGE